MKPGFKQTEVGVIPEDWEISTIGQFSKCYSGGTPSTSQLQFYGGEIPWITSSDLNSRIITDVLGRITQAGLDNSSAKIVDAGTLLLALYGATAGVCAVCDIRGAINQAVLAIIPRNISTPFLYHQLQLRKNALISTFTQGGQPNLSGEIVKGFSVMLPPTTAEQEVIAEALGDADALIESLERLVAKKRDIKQGAMQELLTARRRLPGFSSPNTKFKQSHVGAIPEDWGLVPLVELVDPGRSIRYGIVQPGDYDPQGRFMIRGQDYSEVKGWAKPSEVFRVSPKIEERYRNARVKTGDLIMTIVGYCGHVEIVPAWLDAANLTQTTARIAIRPDRAVSAYCKYVLLSPIGRNQVAAYIKGAAQPGLNCGDLEQFFITLPSIPEQAAIASSLSAMDEEIIVLEEKMAKARMIKQGMMQELLTGRIRLK